MKRLIVVGLLAVGILTVFATAAFANTGHIEASENCHTWSVTVFLNHNTTPDHSVWVTTTIPGTTGIKGGRYNTNVGPIWHREGNAPKAGDVTLYIFQPRRGGGWKLEHKYTAHIAPPGDCVKPPPPTTTTTEVPTSTSTSVPAVTSTTTASTSTVPSTAPPKSPPRRHLTPPTHRVKLCSPTDKACAPTATISGPLPRTGSPTTSVVLFALVSLSAGALALVSTRRKRAAR